MLEKKELNHRIKKRFINKIFHIKNNLMQSKRINLDDESRKRRLEKALIIALEW